jgi:cytochrome c-type biogenesis protein CcmH
VRLIVVVVAALALAPAALASEAHPTQAELEAELICPTCKTTLDQSNAPIALRMKHFIARRIAAGDSKSEIKNQLVAQFGRGVLAAPEKEGFDLLAWIVPLAGLAAGAVALALLLWRWTRRVDEELPLLE